MKKRERYKLIYNEEELGYEIIDTEADLSDNIHGWNILCDLLNQQDKEIKKLKKERSKYKSYKTTDEQNRDLENLYANCKKENRQLRQSKKELAIKKLQEVSNFIDNYSYYKSPPEIIRYINGLIKGLIRGGRVKANNQNKRRDAFKLGLIENTPLEGQFEFPKLKPTQTTFGKYDALAFNFAAITEQKQKFFLHFYIDDYQFERVWRYPEKYLELIKQFKGVVSPDFSLFRDMPKAMQIWNNYRSKALAAFWQANGIDVIPNVSWADDNSFEWCFDGLPKHSTVAVSSVGCMKQPSATLAFCKGFQKMIEVLEPTHILFYGKIPESLKENKKLIQIATHIEISLEEITKEKK